MGHSIEISCCSKSVLMKTIFTDTWEFILKKNTNNDIRCFWICKGNNAVNYLIGTYTKQIDIIIE